MVFPSLIFLRTLYLNIIGVEATLTKLTSIVVSPVVGVVAITHLRIDFVIGLEIPQIGIQTSIGCQIANIINDMLRHTAR